MLSEAYCHLYLRLLETTIQAHQALCAQDFETLDCLLTEHTAMIQALQTAGLSEDTRLLALVQETHAALLALLSDAEQMHDTLGRMLGERWQKQKQLRAYECSAGL